MNKLFLLFLSLSLSGTLLALVLFALKPLLKHRVSRRWQYYVFLIVILRLLIPFSPEANLMNELFHYAEGYHTQANVQTVEEMSAITPAQTVNVFKQPAPQEQTKNMDMAGYIQDDKESLKVFSGRELLDMASGYIWVLWIGVFLLLISKKALNYISLMRSIKSDCMPINDEAVLSVYEKAGKEIGISRLPDLCLYPYASSPMLAGTIKPTVVLPSIDIDEDALRYALMHELVHYKRRDVLYKWLVQIAVCLHWFNPVLYWVRREIERGCELSCDEEVIKKLKYNERISYGDSLLASINLTGSHSYLPASISFNNDKRLIKERLGAIMAYKKKSRSAVIVSLLLTVFLACGAVFTGAYAADSDTSGPQFAYTEGDRNKSFSSQEKIKLLGGEENWELLNDKIVISRKIDGKDIRNMEITAYICNLYFEKSEGDEFEADFAYPRFQEPNYSKYFDLKMERSGADTLIISTDYDDHGFDDLEGYEDIYYDFACELTIKIPERKYDSVGLKLFANYNPALNFDIDAENMAVQLTCDDLDVNINRPYSRLEVVNNVGNITLNMNAQCGETSIQNDVGNFTVVFAEEPQNINLLLNNYSASSYRLPTGWEGVPSGSAMVYKKGSGTNTVSVDNEIGTFRIQAGETPNAAVATAGAVSDGSGTVVPAGVITKIEDYPLIHTNLGGTEYVKNSSFEKNKNKNDIKISRVDVVDESGYASQALIIICQGSDSYTKPYREFSQKLQAAYSDDYGSIVGYLDNNNDPTRSYRYITRNFIAIEEVNFIDRDGIEREALVVAGDGTDEFSADLDELYSQLHDAYFK